MVHRATDLSRQRAAWDASALAGLGLAAWLLARAMADAGLPLAPSGDWRGWLLAGALVPFGAALYGWRRWRERILEMAAAPAAAVSPFHAVFTANPQPMWVVDAVTLAFLEVNDAACRHYGYSRAEFKRLTLAAIRLPEDMPVVRQRVQAPQHRDGFVGRHRRRDGSLFDVEIISHALHWHGREARMAMVRDVSDRLEAERALQRSEARYRKLFKHNLAGVFRITLDGKVLEANPAFARMFGFDNSTQLIEDAAAFRFAPADAMRDFVRKLRAESPWTGIELALRNRNGEPLWILCNPTLVHEQGVETIEGTVFDISERKLLEEQFRQAQKMEAVGRLAAGVAHDFNNLLTVVNGYSDLLLAKPAAAEFHPKLRMIRKAGDRAASLTHQLLAFSRQQVLQPRLLDLNQVLREVEPTLRTLLGETVQLCLNLASEPLPILADAGQIEQVLLNLASNSCDAMPAGGVLAIEPRPVLLDLQYSRLHPGVRPGPYALLAITDTGAGMDPTTLAHVFEPFFSTKPKGQGTGLGLATVFGIVQQSGGHINLDSEVGVGTSVRIYLPQASASPADEPVSTDAEVSTGGETVLVVEDEEHVRGLAEELLAASGYRVLTASHPSAAIAVSRGTADRIHLLLTDVLMPEMNGHALAKILAEERPDMRVLFMSAYPGRAINSEGGPLDPAIAFVKKPFTAESLANAVRRVLAATPETSRPN